jgi:hypothetical protein
MISGILNNLPTGQQGIKEDCGWWKMVAGGWCVVTIEDKLEI